MKKKINKDTLMEISRHFSSLRLMNKVKRLNYERCAELPYIIDDLRSRFGDKLSYLDIGSGGESPLPTYLLKKTNWNITCLDKFNWVQHQLRYASASAKEYSSRFRVIEEGLLDSSLLPESFDIITCVSVIEHFENDTDSQAMKVISSLLKPGGTLILTTLINDQHYKEYYVKDDVYGEVSKNSKGVFYQRHYDLINLKKKLIDPSGIEVKDEIFFGDYGYQCFEEMLQRKRMPMRIYYRLRIVELALKYLSYSDAPINRDNMLMNTASGVILKMVK